MRSVLTAILVLALPATSLGNEPTARRHYERAKLLVKLGDHRGAIRELELSYKADPRPNRLYDLAQQHRILAETGSLDELRISLNFFERYLKERPNAEDRREVEEALADLRSRIASAEAAARDTSTRPGPEPALESKTPTTDVPRSEVPLIPAPDEKPPETKVPAWGWALVGVGSAVVVGGAIGLGFGLSQNVGPPSTTLRGFEVQ